jgi:hypothetical protein
MMNRLIILAFVILVPAIYAEKLQAVISCQRSKAGAPSKLHLKAFFQHIYN